MFKTRSTSASAIRTKEMKKKTRLMRLVMGFIFLSFLSMAAGHEARRPRPRLPARDDQTVIQHLAGVPVDHDDDNGLVRLHEPSLDPGRMVRHRRHADQVSILGRNRVEE